MLGIYFNCMSHYVDFNACFFAETFQPMNAALTFQIGLNDSARAIRGKFTFAGAWEGFWGIRTICKDRSTTFSFSLVNKMQRVMGRVNPSEALRSLQDLFVTRCILFPNEIGKNALQNKIICSMGTQRAETCERRELNPYPLSFVKF